MRKDPPVIHPGKRYSYELGGFVAHSGFQEVTCDWGRLSSKYYVSIENKMEFKIVF